MNAVLKMWKTKNNNAILQRNQVNAVNTFDIKVSQIEKNLKIRGKRKKKIMTLKMA